MILTCMNWIPYNHKFTGGWFNFHSKELTKLMKLPKNIGIFHHIDLFQQEKFKILNQKGHDIPQYIIKNCIILEDRKYSHKNDFWTKYIPLKPGSSGYSQNPDLIFQEIVKELKRLQNE